MRLLLIPVYVHFLSQAEVGTLAFLEAVMIVLSRMFPLGLEQAVKRFYVVHDQEVKADAYVGAIWLVNLLLAGAACALLAFVSHRWGNVLTAQVLPYFLVLAVCAGGLRGSAFVPLQRFVIRDQPLAHGVFSTLQTLTVTGLGLYLVIVAKMGLLGVLWGEILGGAVWLAVFGVSLLRASRPRFRWKEVRASLRYGFPLIPQGFFAWGISFADRIVLERFVPMAAIGLYGVGYQLANVVLIVSFGMAQALLSRFFRTADRRAATESYPRTFAYGEFVVLGLVLTMVVFAREIIEIVATPAYAESVGILQIVAFALLFQGAYQALAIPLLYAEETASVTIAAALGFFFKLLFNILFAQRWGIYAAAWSTVGAYLLTAWYSYLSARRCFDFRLPFKTMMIASAIAGAVGVAALSVPVDSLAARVLTKGVLLLLYPIGVLFMPGVLETEERRLAIDSGRRLFRKLAGRGIAPRDGPNV